ncbi:MAG: M4 family metallopeptidase [Saprospiraceae bacterium]|nr:M4 family metallopeptidase [Saprospiraceae bacterium]
MTNQNKSANRAFVESQIDGYRRYKFQLGQIHQRNIQLYDFIACFCVGLWNELKQGAQTLIVTKKLLYPMVAMAILMVSTNLNAQSFTPKALRNDNQAIQSITNKVEPAGWLYLKDESQILAYDLFSTFKTDMGLSSNDSMVLMSDKTDDHGWQHIRYQQYYKNIKVESAEYTEHLNYCVVKIAHGKLLENADISVTPSITESQALEIALDSIGATTYSWEENSSGVNEYEEGEIYDTLPPRGELLLGYITQTGILPENFKLVWKFVVISSDPGAAIEIYIDAQNGEVARKRSLEYDNGPASLLYSYGTQTIDTRYHNGWFNDYYFLKAEENNRNIHTRKGSFSQHDQRWNKYEEATDDNDSWGTAASNWTTAHWITSQSWDYFNSVHHRNGFTGNGDKIYVLANSTLQNAGFRDVGLGWLEFGNWDGAQLAAIDVAGHEFAHGVTRHSSNLGFVGQPGALNESFSDIFGFLVERFSFPGDFDWTIGEDPFPGGLRSLEDPGSIPTLFPLADRPVAGLPNVFMGDRWYPGVLDNSGVHINCGPQNRWFYLLSEGGTETETGLGAQSIGIDNAAAITYYSLTSFMQNGSLYADAREGAIAAAIILFGNCSFEVIQTTNAWAAVGVGDVFAQGPCIIIEGPEVVCADLLPEQWHAEALSGATITWSVPSAWSYTLSGTGNNTLNLNSVYPPTPPATSYTYTISATASTGGTATLDVIVEFDCDPHNPLTPCLIYDRSMHSELETNETLLENAFVSIYPNPGNDLILVKIDNKGELFAIAIIDAFGRKVLSDQSSSSHFTLNIEQLKPGIFYLEVSNSSFHKTIPFVKQ